MDGTLEVYQFTQRYILALSPVESSSLLDLKPGSRVRVNFGLDHAIIVDSSSDRVTVNIKGLLVDVERDLLLYSINTGKAVIYTNKGWITGEVRSKRYYKLAPLDKGAPTLEIDGIHMHKIRDTDPLRDARTKVKSARISKGHVVLDICTGLGYTGIESLRSGASRIYTIEIDENVLYLASLNPWSSDLSNEKITIIHGDATNIVYDLYEEVFHRIIHDPPRLTPRTGDLYSLDFYKRLYNLLKPGGILFHYTGEPGRKRKLNIPGSVSSRLKKAGFEVIGYNEKAEGVVAYRPG
ncbi:MAG: RsmD family RNA methyltransferase [Desulfurococcales archaeon]|nr:RsmD family RNA methyltransferase [Desulfurococcales archaeon]